MRSALMALSTLLVAERDREAPNTAMAETRASPTIRADAVCAVRRGLRIEFSRPSRPDIPSRRASGRPMTLGHAAGPPPGPAWPRRRRSARRPGRPARWPAAVRPERQQTPPRSTAMTPPRMKRRRSGTSSSACWSETAATGAIRTARRAGLMAETTVTPDADDEAHDDRARLEHERPRRQRDAEPAAAASRARWRPAPRVRGRSATTPAPRSPPRRGRSGTPGGGWRPTMRSSASSRVR